MKNHHLGKKTWNFFQASNQQIQETVYKKTNRSLGWILKADGTPYFSFGKIVFLVKSPCNCNSYYSWDKRRVYDEFFKLRGKGVLDMTMFLPKSPLFFEASVRCFELLLFLSSELLATIKKYRNGWYKGLWDHPECCWQVKRILTFL